MAAAREFYVTLGGKRMALRFDLFDDTVETIEAAFPRPDGTPGSVGALAVSHILQPGSLLVQTTILYHGLKHIKGVTQADVRRWYLEHVQNGGTRREILTEVWKALRVSGLMGYVGEVKDEEATEPDGGKAPPVRAAE